jgi:hypothetical protein
LNHPDSDEDDGSGWEAWDCSWDIVSGLDNVPPNYERVLLKSRVAVKGEHAQLSVIGFHAVIEARALIDIHKPGPAHY